MCQPQGTGEWRVPESSAANCHCSAVIALGVDHGAELPFSSRLRTGDVMRSVFIRKHKAAVQFRDEPSVVSFCLNNTSSLKL